MSAARHISEEASAGASRRGRLARAATCLAFTGVLCWWFVYLVGGVLGWVWWIDVLASGLVPALVVVMSLSAAGVWVGGRLVRFLLITACVLMLVVVLPGRSMLPNAGRDPVPAAGDVSMLTINVRMSNQRPQEVWGVVVERDADVVVLVEPVWNLFAGLTRTGEITDYQHMVFRDRVEDRVSPMVVLSRWPMRALDGLGSSEGLGVLVERPSELGGAFWVVGIHAVSPRGEVRWDLGNSVVSGVCSWVRGQPGAGVVLGDLNGGPLSYREGMLRGAGLTRGKPIFQLGGTYPSLFPIPGVAIDDIWTSDGCRVRSWTTVPVPESDHLGVLGVVRIAGEAAER